MEFVDKEGSVINQKLADFLFPERKRQAAHDTDIGEKETLIIRGWRGERLAIPEVDAFVIAFESARVVIDHVKRHRNAIEMAEVDHRLELIGTAGDLVRGQRSAALGDELAVDVREVTFQRAGIVYRVERVRREQGRTVISLVRRFLAFGDRQRLQQ